MMPMEAEECFKKYTENQLKCRLPWIKKKSKYKG
jgi:hypothetical protein